MSPPELYGGAGTWTDLGVLAPQQHDRGYHAAGGLLPDGRAFQAGGQGAPGHETGTYHTVDVFAPNYYFMPRPQIQVAPTVIDLDEPSGLFNVELTRVDSESEIAWMALVKPS